MSKSLPIVNLVVLGKGVVGTAWLDGVSELLARYVSVADIRLVTVANSTRAIVNVAGLTITDIHRFSELAELYDLDQIIECVGGAKIGNILVLDLTASDQVADYYLEFAERGWNIISANKKPLTKSTERHKLITNTFKRNGLYWGINATVGAALPVQSSLSELLQAGDKLLSITGVFSGSLSYLLSHYDGKQSFTKLIQQAREVGMTEPDPRDDLSGTDVQRKLLILARVAGHSVNLNDIHVEPLLPAKLLAGEIEQFWSRHEVIDHYMSEAFQRAIEDNKKLAYQAQVSFVDKVAEGQVGLCALDQRNPLIDLTPADNVITLTTEFYQTNPLIIRGPGAGALVTAAAVNIDLNKYILQIAVAASGQGNLQTELY